MPPQPSGRTLVRVEPSKLESVSLDKGAWLTTQAVAMAGMRGPPSSSGIRGRVAPDGERPRFGVPSDEAFGGIRKVQLGVARSRRSGTVDCGQGTTTRLRRLEALCIHLLSLTRLEELLD